MRDYLHEYSAETREKMELCQPGQLKALDFCVEVFIDGENPQGPLIARLNALWEAIYYGILYYYFLCRSRWDIIENVSLPSFDTTFTFSAVLFNVCFILFLSDHVRMHLFIDIICQYTLD